MKLVFIYGAPAVGKLTVATELGRLTSFAVWDNHQSIDCLLPLFPFGSEPFNRLSEQMRVTVLAEAARQGVDAIFTFAFSYPGDIGCAARIFAAVEENGGTVCLAQLICMVEEQERRVLSEDRERRQKVRNVDFIRELNAKHDFATPIPGRPGLTIDTTTTTPADAARRIIERYALPAMGSL
jgi:hypothetical protein